MDLSTAIFYLIALVTVVSAGMVAFSRNIIYSAFSLLGTFMGVAGLYVFLGADFVAAVQLLIYVGGILVLVMFGVMLTSNVLDVQLRSSTMNVLPAILLVGAIAAALLMVFWNTDWTVLTQAPSMQNTGPRIGELMLTRFLLPFEIASVILLVALIGAAMIARREKKS